MKFIRYNNIESFAADTFEILLENEAQNSLPISFIEDKELDKSDWFLAAVKGSDGGVLLTAAQTPPFNMLVYETRNIPNEAAVKLLADEIKKIDSQIVEFPRIPGILAERGLAERFAQNYAADNGAEKHLQMKIMRLNMMRLDKINEVEKAPGFCRPFREDDMFYAPYWERVFREDCGVENFSIELNAKRLEHHLGKDSYYIWEDSHPVSQAYNDWNTENGAMISGVYTPPYYRGRGYASSVTAALSRTLLERKKYCCLFANAANYAARGIYRKIGYYDICEFEEIKFGD
ncbi:MAG: GNAT family N-acetyltransferase [Oscillospiraceae bacterium]|nr:GNAT family N-acetyltransferase [Oscillospiraceae bacterium]